ncbi:nucleoid-associated protein, partial [Flavobacterium sp.]|uniref:nucleoid-associated protein n=1 Tax=Flavobacterium sp. TaxID=239 RepID=UPI00262F4E69
HKLNKKANEAATIELADDSLMITEREISFIKSIKDAYYKKSNPIYGVFDDNRITFPYQSILDEYFQNTISFLEYSVLSMRHLLGTIDRVSPATGGYVVFAHYELNEDDDPNIDEAEPYTMVVMLNDKIIYNVNNSLTLDELFGLDIEKIDVANLVNYNRWVSNEETYLSFARGRKDVSNYFRTFIGCTDQRSSYDSSKLLKKAVLDYLGTLDIDDDRKEEIRNSIFTYCISQTNSNQDISLDHVSSIIDNDNPERFSQFAAGENYRVSSSIKGNKKALKDLKYYVYKSKKLRLEFDSALVNDQIFYNSEDNTITITDVPDELQEQLRRDF